MIQSRAQLRMGTSSFSSKDWVGPFYPPGTKPKDYLRHYAAQFDCVEVDATYYAVPATGTVQGWDDKTPDDFLLCAKFPRSIVHGGETPRPDPRVLLMPDTTYADRDDFLRAMSILGPKLGPLLLQFPFFNRQAFPDSGPFLDRLDGFLGDLPRDFAYAVEIRNKEWLGKELTDVLRKHNVSTTLVDQAWMPHGDRLEGRLDYHTGSWIYVRLLGDRAQIEAITKTWEREVIDRGPRLERWAEFIVKSQRQGSSTLVFVNNHYAGHAPATLERLRREVRQRQAAEA